MQLEVNDPLSLIVPICASLLEPPKPVMLDVQSLRSDVVLLLDSFFHVLVWHGEMIHLWKEQGYENSPEYSNFRELLEVSI